MISPFTLSGFFVSIFCIKIQIFYRQFLNIVEKFLIENEGHTTLIQTIFSNKSFVDLQSETEGYALTNSIFLGSCNWKIFQKLHFGLEFPGIANPKKIPQIRRDNLAILEKLRDSANSKPTFHSFQKSKTLFQNNLTI